MIDRAHLQVDEEKQQRASQQQARLKAVIEEVLTAGPERRYILRNLKAVQLAAPIYRQLAAHSAGWEKAATHHAYVSDSSAPGCHRYDRQEKTVASRAAHDAASLASMELLLSMTLPRQTPCWMHIQQDLLPGVCAGLLRRHGASGRGRRCPFRKSCANLLFG